MAAKSKENLAGDMSIPPIMDAGESKKGGKGRVALRIFLLLVVLGLIGYAGFKYAPAVMVYLSGDKKTASRETKQYGSRRNPQTASRIARPGLTPVPQKPAATGPRIVHDPQVRKLGPTPAKRLKEAPQVAQPSQTVPSTNVTKEQVDKLVEKQRSIKTAQLNAESYQAQNKEMEQEIQFHINKTLKKVVESENFEKLAKQNPQLLMAAMGKGGKANPMASLLTAMQTPTQPMEKAPEIIVPEYGEGPQVKMVYADDPPRQALIYYRGQKLLVEEGRKIGDILVKKIHPSGTVDFVFKGKKFSRTVTATIIASPSNDATQTIGSRSRPAKRDYPGSRRANDKTRRNGGEITTKR